MTTFWSMAIVMASSRSLRLGPSNAKDMEMMLTLSFCVANSMANLRSEVEDVT